MCALGGKTLKFSILTLKLGIQFPRSIINIIRKHFYYLTLDRSLTVSGCPPSLSLALALAVGYRGMKDIYSSLLINNVSLVHHYYMAFQTTLLRLLYSGNFSDFNQANTLLHFCYLTKFQYRSGCENNYICEAFLTHIGEHVFLR